MGRRHAALLLGWLVAACSHSQILDTSTALPRPATTRVADAEAPSVGRQELPEGEQVRVEGQRYIDPRMGFEISRPDGEWVFAPGQTVTEGIAVPVIVAHPQSGAQVVVQVAPAVATPTEFAMRLTRGLSARAGFATGAPAPLPGTEEGVGFPFTMGGAVTGRVAILPAPGHVFVLLATWPTQCPHAIILSVDGIVRSLRTGTTSG